MNFMKKKEENQYPREKKSRHECLFFYPNIRRTTKKESSTSTEILNPIIILLSSRVAYRTPGNASERTSTIQIFSHDQKINNPAWGLLHFLIGFRFTWGKRCKVCNN